MLHREERRHLVMLQDDLTFRVQDEPNVEEAIREIGMTGFGLGDDESIVGTCDLAQLIGFFARDIDRALTRELDMVEVEHFVIESLECPFRKSDQPDWQI